MSDHATRRDAQVRNTLAAIAAVIPVECMTCGQPVPRHSVLHLFCSKVCHTEALAYPAERRDDDTTAKRVEINVGTATVPDWQPLPGATDIEIGPNLDADNEMIPTMQPWSVTADVTTDAESLSVVAAVIQSMDAASDEVARRHAARLRRFDLADHADHRRESRGGYTLWVLVVAVVLAASLLATSEFWPVTVIAGVGAVIAALLAWVSVGNGRAAATSCPICHPPCDDDTAG